MKINNIEQEILEELRRSSKGINNLLKKRIGRYCFQLVEQTPEDKHLIRKTSYKITGLLGKYTYNDELDDIIDMFGELELLERHVSGKESLRLWRELKLRLEKYNSKE